MYKGAQSADAQYKRSEQCLGQIKVPFGSGVFYRQSEDGLRRAIGEAHRRYTRRVKFRKKWRGHLWQGRFASFVMDEPYLPACVRYVEMTPVRADLCRPRGVRNEILGLYVLGNPATA